MARRHALQFRGLADEVLLEEATVDPASAAAGAEISGTITVEGAELGDLVFIAPGVDLETMLLSYSVISDDTVEWVLLNETAAAVDLASSTWKVVVLKLNTSVFKE